MKIVVTTSRRPTQRVRSFLKDFASVLPNAIRVNRGKATLTDLASYALEIGADRVAIITTRKGNPSSILVYEVSSDSSLKRMHRLVLLGVKLSREYGGSPCPKHEKLCIDTSSISSGLGEEVAEALTTDFSMIPITSTDEALPGSIVAVLDDRGEEVIVRFMKRDKSMCGPRIRVGKVIKYEL